MDELKPMEQRNEPSTEELIKNARYCCGDIECEGETDCGDYCLDGRDERNGDLRWCRQWMVHDLADRLELIQRELFEKSEQLEAAKARHARKDAESAELYEKAVARAERAEAERDAAIADIESFMRTSGACDYCGWKSNERGCTCKSFGCMPKWRGKPQEGEKE